MYEGITAKFSEVFLSIGQLVNDNISQPVKDKVSDFFSVGKDLITGIWNGIENKIEWLKSKVKGLVDIIKGLVHRQGRLRQQFPVEMGNQDGRYHPAGNRDRPREGLGGSALVRFERDQQIKARCRVPAGTWRQAEAQRVRPVPALRRSTCSTSTPRTRRPPWKRRTRRSRRCSAADGRCPHEGYLYLRQRQGRCALAFSAANGYRIMSITGTSGIPVSANQAQGIGQIGTTVQSRVVQSVPMTITGYLFGTRAQIEQRAERLCSRSCCRTSAGNCITTDGTTGSSRRPRRPSSTARCGFRGSSFRCLLRIRTGCWIRRPRRF